MVLLNKNKIKKYFIRHDISIDNFRLIGEKNGEPLYRFLVTNGEKIDGEISLSSITKLRQILIEVLTKPSEYCMEHLGHIRTYHLLTDSNIKIWGYKSTINQIIVVTQKEEWSAGMFLNIDVEDIPLFIDFLTEENLNIWNTKFLWLKNLFNKIKTYIFAI